MIVIPFKVPKPCQIIPPLASWLDTCCSYSGRTNEGSLQSNRRPSIEFDDDLQQLAALRKSLCSYIISSRDDRNAARDPQLYEACQRYYIGLQQCEQRGFPASESEPLPNLQLIWENAFDSEQSTHSNVRSERECVLFTLAAVESHLASLDSPVSSSALTESAKHFNRAAGIIALLLQLLSPPPVPRAGKPSMDLGHNTLQFMRSLMLAQSQTCTFVTATLRPRIIHSVMAKVAMGCAEFYREALGYIQAQPTLLSNHMNNGRQWECYIKAHNLQWLAVAEYHKVMDSKDAAITKRDAGAFALALARIRAAEAHVAQSVSLARDCAGEGMFSIEELGERQRQIVQLHQELEQEHDSFRDVVVPLCQDLEPIIASVIAKPTPLTEENVVSSMESQASWFVGLIPMTSKPLEKFEQESQRMLQETKELVAKQTTEIRETLASVNLPQALEDVSSSSHNYISAAWGKVKDVQKQNIIPQLKENLWMLRDTAEWTRGIAKVLREGLDRDVEIDREFRLKHPNFRGTKAAKAQLVIRNELQRFATFLENAKKGDAVLLKMLESLDTEYKFKLLDLSREEIERLVPRNAQKLGFDESHLRYLLKEMSGLLRRRDSLLGKMRAQTKSTTIKERLCPANRPISKCQHCEEITAEELAHFANIRLEIERNISEQQPLLDKILSENKAFAAARQVNSAVIRWENIIQSIEEALHAVKTKNEQASEGHTFYNSILPRITGLQQQASDLSARMAVERYDFEEREYYRERLRQQDMEDAKVAAQLTRELEEEDRVRVARDAAMAASLARHSTETLETAVPNSSSDGMTDAPRAASTDAHRVASHPGSQFSNVASDPDSLTEALLASENARDEVSSSTHAVASASGSYRPPQVAPSRPALLRHTSAGIPGVYQVSHFEKPPTRVDDELVASLVAMDFDAEKAVEALARHDNNFEHALNDLLSENIR